MAVSFEVVAPVRICDAGGWTDTWFAGNGRVCSIAVEPGARVVLDALDEPGPIMLDVVATGERYEVRPEGDGTGRHPLLEAALRQAALPADRGVHARIETGVPPGCGTGTSAAVIVALLAALHAFRNDGAPIDAHVVASLAHGVEIGLGLQSGVQDQHAAAFGGANEMIIDLYPETRVVPITLPSNVIEELDARLVTVYLGRPHASSPVHESVIAHLTPSALEPLRLAAAATADALRRRDIDGYGAALAGNTDAQAGLHADLVSPDAHALIDLARGFGAAGWKVNGAGGDGGTVTVVASSDVHARAAMITEIEAVDRWSVLPLRFAPRGVTVGDMRR